MSSKVPTVLALAIGVALGVSLSLSRGVLADRQSPNQRESLPWEDARLLAEVLERVKHDYVERVDDHALMENAVRGMLSALDPHSAFLDNREYDEIRVSTTGAYSGVGIEVSLENDTIKVVKPIEGTPAARAGIRAGDIIVSIDGETVGTTSLTDAINRMRGRAGTNVTVTVTRSDQPDPIEFVLERSNVQVHSVQHELLEPGYGYVRITHFSETTGSDLTRAIAALREASAAGLHGLVLDLRNNPGGVLEAAVSVSDAFLNDGVIVTASGRSKDSQFAMDATPGDLLEGGELVVLVNSGSASASEIVAGALKDHGRAMLMGRTTFGKGSVQTVMPLSDGRAIKLTTSRYYTPSGASIHEKGIVPDIIVERDLVLEELPAPEATIVQRDAEVRLALSRLKQDGPVQQSQLVAPSGS